MNTTTLTGEILRHGVKESKFPKLWIQVETSSPPSSGLNSNKFFVNIDIDPNPQSKMGRVAEIIKDKLKTNKFIALMDITLANMKVGNKLDNGEWENKEVLGVKVGLTNIGLSSARYDPINICQVSGIVDKYHLSNNLEKLVILEKYRVPTSGEYKTREIPILHNASNNPLDLTGKRIHVVGTLCGTTPNGESKVYVWSKNLIQI